MPSHLHWEYSHHGIFYWCFKFYRVVSGSVRQVDLANKTSVIAFMYCFLKGILDVRRTPNA